jgi:cytochrome c oxidase subunit 2
MHFQRVFGQAFGLEAGIAAVVFGAVLIAVAAAIIASWWRRRRGRPASGRSERNGLELAYVLALTGVVVFVIGVSFSANASFWRDPPPAMTVRVTAFQWCWNFRYEKQPVDVVAACEGGGTPTLVLPAGRPVRVELASRDVIHSFWVPGLRFKVDIYPDHVNSFTFTLPQGRWTGRCAQFCGVYHDDMVFRLQAVPVARFDRWLHARGGPAQAVSPR